MDKVPMTTISYALLEEELKKLKSEDRPNVIKAIAEAREHGDLSENAEYHAAKEQQSFIEGRILELEYKVTRAEVIDTSSIKSNKILLTSELDFPPRHKIGFVDWIYSRNFKGNTPVEFW